MPVVIKAPAAQSDLDEIWLYVAMASSQTRATRLLRSIEEKLGLLAENPLMGRARPELAPNLRSFPVGSYVVYYRPLPDGIEVAHVRHGAQDIDELFR